MRLYRISATVKVHTAHGFIPQVVPTFCLDKDVHGIVNEEHARLIASDILDAKGKTDHPTYITAVEV